MRQIRLIMLKELKETLRDPHVVVFLTFPLVLFSVMIWGALELATLTAGWKEQQAYVLDVQGPPALRDALLTPPAREGVGGLAALEDGSVDLVIVGEEDGPTWTVTIHRTSRPDSLHALSQVSERLDALRQDRLAELALAHGLTPEQLSPPQIDSEPLSGPDVALAGVLALAVAVLAPMSMVVAGIYPAIELVVSERERGTLETTLVAPTSRAAVLTGKLLALVAMVLAVLCANFVGLALSVAQIVASLPAGVVDLSPPPLSAALVALPIVLSSALFWSAACMLAMVPTRTFQEGQLAATLVLFLGMAPGATVFLSLIVGEVNPVSWWIPLANTTLVLHAAMTSSWTVSQALGPALVNTILAGLLILVTARIAGREDYLIGGKLPRWLAWIRRGDAS